MLVLLMLIFAVQNSEIVDVQLLRWHLKMPRSVLIFTMLLIGFIIGWSSRVLYRVIKGQRKYDSTRLLDSGCNVRGDENTAT